MEHDQKGLRHDIEIVLSRFVARQIKNVLVRPRMVSCWLRDAQKDCSDIQILEKVSRVTPAPWTHTYTQTHSHLYPVASKCAHMWRWLEKGKRLCWFVGWVEQKKNKPHLRNEQTHKYRNVHVWVWCLDDAWNLVLHNGPKHAERRIRRIYIYINTLFFSIDLNRGVYRVNNTPFTSRARRCLRTCVNFKQCNRYTRI